MSWSIPPPYVVHEPKPLRWNGWWRGFSFCCIAVLLLGAGGYFWLKDPRVLLYAFITVVVVCVLFGILAGWMLFRFGVEGEHAEGLRQLNSLNEREWQRWAQQALPVLGFHSVFSPLVHTPDKAGVPVNRDEPLLLPPFPGYVWLFDELLIPLLPELHSLVSHHHRIEVYLPQGCDSNEWRLFSESWQTQGLSVSALLPPIFGLSDHATQMHHWLKDKATDTARLVMVDHWNGSGEGSEGAIVWLLGSSDWTADIPRRCALHRPMLTNANEAELAIRQFLHYQPITASMNGLWSDAQSKEHVETLIMAHSQRLKFDKTEATPPLPHQHFLPHWLGKTGPCADWFGVTLMMQMAQASSGVQCAILSQGTSRVVSSVSAGAFTDE